MMSLIQLLLLTISVPSLAAPILPRAAPSFVYPGDAPFTVSPSALAAAFTCPNGNPTSSKPPVLLVHGTGSTGEETWGQGYVPALSANGYTPCYITIPGRSMGDMQVSAEYVAYGIHLITSLSAGASTAIISHSQGGPNVQWALRFWPSTRPITTSFIPLSPDFSGIELLGSDLHDFCIGDLCQAAIWQQSAGSAYYAAMHADTFEELVPTTAIWSQSDGVVNPPQQNAQLPGAVTMSVQDLCPLRVVTHLQMPIDAAAYALAMDALTHGGEGSVSRAAASNPFSCLEFTAPHMDFSVSVSLQDTWDAIVDGIILGSPRVSQEPAVDAYALHPTSSG